MGKTLALLLLCQLQEVVALDNGAALRPPLGWQNWNGFSMGFNASLFRTMAQSMKENGLLAAGYDMISAGGNTYPHQGMPPWNSTNSSNIANIIVRNKSGYYQIDPARFPGPGSSTDCLNETKLRACLANHSKNHNWVNGDPAHCGCTNGNEGMAELSSELRAMGFKWGSYSNEAGCQVDACNVSTLNSSRYRGFVDEDADLFLNKWHSDYIMVDSVGGFGTRPYPKSDPRWWSFPKTLLTEWSEKVKNFSRPVILHSCHNDCGSKFNGPTLVAAKCNTTDLSQLWAVPAVHSSSSPPSVNSAPAPNHGYLHDAGEGLCVGCGGYVSGCANDALAFHNGSGYGAGMAACGNVCPYCAKTQQWNYSTAGVASKMVIREDGSCLQVFINTEASTGASTGTGANTGRQTTGTAPAVVVQYAHLCNVSQPLPAQQWERGPALTLAQAQQTNAVGDSVDRRSRSSSRSSRSWHHHHGRKRNQEPTDEVSGLTVWY
jgi:hypothetical protein